MNLLKETIDKIERSGFSVEDVEWVGSKDGLYSIAWNYFVSIADVEYDNRYGVVGIAEDLVVVGNGWWLERGEYDGAEWWSFNTAPFRLACKPFTKVHGGIRSTLDQIQKGEV